MAAIFVWTLNSVMAIAVFVGFTSLLLLGSAIDLYDRKFKRR